MLSHVVHVPRVHSRFYTPWPQMPRRCGQTKAKHTQSRPGSPGPIWHCEGPRNHDNDTGDIARDQCWSTSCTHGMYKAEFLLLGPKCRVGAAKPRQNTRNPDLAFQGPSGTAEGRQTMTTTPETSQEINAGPCLARTACAKPSFHSLAPNVALVQPNQGKTHTIQTSLSRAHLVLPRAVKP